MSEVISPSFQIHLSDGTVEEYLQSEKVKYHWTVGNSGVLMVFRDVMHAMFAVSLKQDERISALNAGEWKRVVTIEDPVEVDDITQDQVDDSVIAMS
jgi:hypothetical protein